jgi:uncharacterized membrane protein HdeD (DUF308 family)
MQTQLPASEMLKKATGKAWWLFLLRGLIAILFGFFVVLQPGMAVATFVVVLGWYWLLEGILTIIAAVAGRTGDTKWYWALLSGLVSVIAAIIVLGAPLLTAAFIGVTLLWILAIGAIISGILNIVNAVRWRKEIENEWSIILSGVLSLLFGVLVLSAPMAFGRFLIILLGITAIFNGLGLMLVALRVRRLSKAL